MNLRDYIYFDGDRVRILAAQLGVNTGDTDADVQLPHTIYATVEQSLLDAGKVGQIGADFDYAEKWSEGAFTDGQLVLTSGVFRILDYEYTSQFLGATPELMRTAYHMANWSAAKEAVSHNQKKQLD